MANYNLYRQQCPAGSVPYTIRSGDTLSRIASDYASNVRDIMNANPGIDPNYLRVGQQICVPLTMQLYPLCRTRNYYVVIKGDTLQSISNYFNVTYNQLYYSNYGIDPDELYVDQVLCIPVAPSPVEVKIQSIDKKLRVYHNQTLIFTYPFALQDSSSIVPKGIFKVLNKQVDTGSAGGSRWIGLSEAGFGIRGENTLKSIDIVSSSNSIVLSNRDVNKLFNLTPVGTVVEIS